jgi:RNA polymerase sigma-70 factor (family 1)
VAISCVYDENELLLKVAVGNENAFEQLYDHYSDTIYGIAYAYLKSQPIAEEIVQDIFLKIWIGRKSLAKIDHFSNYVFIITRNHILNTLHRKVRERNYLAHLSTILKENSISPEQELMGKESDAIINKAIFNLPPQQRLIYQLVRLNGMKLKEVAAQLGLTRNTVRNHLCRAVKFIRSFTHQGLQALLLMLFSLLVS